jgi:hypothetical protein
VQTQHENKLKTTATRLFWGKLSRMLLGIIGLTGHEYPGVGRDAALAIPMGFAALVLIVYPTESHPSERLRYAAVISLVILVVGLLLAQRKLIVIAGIAGFVALRGLIAVAQGVWQGLIIAGIAAVVVVFCIRSSPAD